MFSLPLLMTDSYRTDLHRSARRDLDLIKLQQQPDKHKHGVQYTHAYSGVYVLVRLIKTRVNFYEFVNNSDTEFI